MNSPQNIGQGYSPKYINLKDSKSPKARYDKPESEKSFEFPSQSYISRSQQGLKPNSRILSPTFLSTKPDFSTEINDVYEFRKQCFDKVKNLESVVEKNKTSYESEISYLQEYINLLRKKIGKDENFGQENLGCEACKEKNRANSKLISHIDELKQALNAVEGQNQLLKVDNFNKKQEISQLSRHLTQQNNDSELLNLISSLEQTKKAHEDLISNLQQEKKHLENLIQKKSFKIDDLEKGKIHSQTPVYEDLDKIKQNLQRKVEESLKICEKRFSGAMERAQNLDEESVRLGKISKKLKDKLIEIHEKDSENIGNSDFCSKKFEEVVEENEKLSDRIDQMMGEMKGLEKNYANIVGENGLNNEKSQKMKEELDCFIKANKTFEEKIKNNEEVIIALKAELESTKDFIKKTVQVEQLLKEKSEGLIEEVKTRHDEIKGLKQEIEILNKEKAGFVTEKDLMDKEINKLNELIKALNTVNAKYEDDIKNLSKKIEEIEKDNTKTQEESQERLEKSNRLSQKLDEMSLLVENKKKKIKKLQSQVEEGEKVGESNIILQEKIADKDRDIEKLQEIIEKSLKSLHQVPYTQNHDSFKPSQNIHPELVSIKLLAQFPESSQEAQHTTKYLQIIEDLSEKIQDYISSTDHLQENLAEATTKLSESQKKNSELEKKLKIQTDENFDLENSMQKMQKNLEESESAAFSMAQEQDDMILGLKKDLKHKKDEVEKLQDMLQNSLSKICEPHMQNAFIKDDDFSIESRINGMKNVVKEEIPIKTWEIIEDIIGKLEYFIRNKEGLEGKIKEMQEENRKLTDLISLQREKVGKFDEMAEDNENYKVAAVNDQKEIAALAGELHLLKAENKNFGKKVQDFKTHNKNQLLQIQELQKSLEKEQTESQKLNQEIENMKNYMEDMRKDMENMRKDMENELKEKKSLELQIKSTENQLEKEKEQHLEYEEHVTALKSQLEFEMEGKKVLDLHMTSNKEQLEKAKEVILVYEEDAKSLMSRLEKEKNRNEDLVKRLKESQHSENREKAANEHLAEKMQELSQALKKSHSLEGVVESIIGTLDDQKAKNDSFIRDIRKMHNPEPEKINKDHVKNIEKRLLEQGDFFEELEEKLLKLEEVPLLVNELEQIKAKVQIQGENITHLLGFIQKNAHLLPSDTAEIQEIYIKTSEAQIAIKGQSCNSTPDLTEELKNAKEKLSNQTLLLEKLQKQLKNQENYQEILNKLIDSEKKLDHQCQIIESLQDQIKAHSNSLSLSQDSTRLPINSKATSEEIKEFSKQGYESLSIPVSANENTIKSNTFLQTEPENPIEIIKIQPSKTQKLPESLQEAHLQISSLLQTIEELQDKLQKNTKPEENPSESSEILVSDKESLLLSKIKYQNDLLTEMENKNLELESRFNRIRNKNNLLESNTKKYSENVEKIFKDVNKKLQVIEKKMNNKEEKVQSIFNDYMQFKKKYIAGFQEKARAFIEDLSFGNIGKTLEEDENGDKVEVVRVLKARVEFLQDKIDCLVKANYVTKELIENISDKAHDAMETIKVE